MRAPLQLDDYFFTQLCVEANPDHKIDREGAGDTSNVDFNIGLEFSAHPEKADRYQLSLSLQDFKAKQGTIPYRIRVQVVGLITVDPKFDHNDREKVIQVNAATMLYGAAREQVLTITGRCPWGGYQLPTANFYSLLSSGEANDQ